MAMRQKSITLTLSRSRTIIIDVGVTIHLVFLAPMQVCHDGEKHHGLARAGVTYPRCCVKLPSRFQ